MYILLLVWCHHTHTKSNLYLDSSLDTIFREPAQYKLTFHVPNLISIFGCLGHLSKESVQV
jgi:hypothetical protein